MKFEIRRYKEVESTNDVAKELAMEGASEGTTVIAEKQTKGRGRYGKQWISPEGGVYLSIVLRPKIDPEESPKITFIAGVAVAKAIRELYNIDAKIKWPNDVLIREKKVCGILTEIKVTDLVNFVILGIGINANVKVEEFPREIREGATSLMKEVGKEIDIDKLIDKVLKNIEFYYSIFKKDGFDRILQEWSKLSATLWRKVRITTKSGTVEGTAIGIDKNGSLIVETSERKIERVIAGECFHL
ncbi:MAG: biotin--[acetyl-CoA-carboxylase] ligase [Thermoplasmata archaeon]|nr:MAG: biotin--[acetyl-CoA-carboxylase] ligase [Thermoplasmata archaeon]